MKPEVQLLKGALEKYSPTGNTKSVADFLFRWCKKHKMDVEVANNMLIINPMANELLILGHMDTVTGKIKVEEKNGDLYGRGAADAKGPLCAAIATVEKHEELWEHACIVAAPDEEGASKVAQAIRDNWKERPCVILEPSTF